MNTLSSTDEFKVLKLPAKKKKTKKKTQKNKTSLGSLAVKKRTPPPLDRIYFMKIMALKSMSSEQTYYTLQSVFL